MLKRMIEVALSFNQVPGKPAREKKAKQEAEKKTAFYLYVAKRKSADAAEGERTFGA